MSRLYEGAEALAKFDEYEMHPVSAMDSNGNTIKQGDFRKLAITDLEQCDEDDPDIYCWSVYGHLPQAGIDCLVDCPTKEIALALLSVLRATL